MSRFVLRCRGDGAVTTDQAVQSAARAGARVLDVSERMLLVECGPGEARALRAALPDWKVMAERVVVKRPRQPRPKLRRRTVLP